MPGRSGIFALVLFSRLLTAQPAPPRLTLPRLAQPPKLEDFEGMKANGSVAGAMARIEGLIQRDPADGKPVTQRTEVYVGYDDHNFYAVFLCFDSEPGQIRARMSRRETIFSDDIVAIFLDAFHDRRRAYEFFVNPLGIQADAISTEGQGDDMSFDTLWRSEGRLTPQGYVVLMAVPFKSLRFSNDAEQTWGFGVSRFIPRNNEQSFWPYNTRKVEGFAQQLAVLDGLHEISPGRNLQFIPYGLFARSRFLDQRGTPVFRSETEGRVGLDTKVVLRDALTLDVTLNPDFSQVESDDPQVTVNQRYEVFFPEKRPFFLENAGYFQTPINLFFSRRIVDPEFGARLTGKVGKWAVAGLLADDRAPGRRVAEDDPAHGGRAGFGVMRVSREFGKQSHVGLMFTDREFHGSFNRVGGADARWKFSKNWVTNLQALTSSTRASDGSYRAGPAYFSDISYNSRKFNYGTYYSDFAAGFTTETGFLQRTGIRSSGSSFNYRFYPEGKLQSWGVHSQAGWTWDRTGTRLDFESFNDLSFNFKRETFFGVLYNPFRERLRPVDFPVLARNRDYSHHQPGIFGGTSYLRQVSLFCLMRFGPRINFAAPAGQEPFLASTTVGSCDLTLRPFSRLRLDNTYIISRYVDRGPQHANIFNNHILRSKWNWQFNRELSLRMILQYDTLLANPALTSLRTRKNFNADFLITYLLHPGTAIYVGYNGNAQNLDRRLLLTGDGLARTRGSFLQDSGQFFVKMSWLFRF